MVGSHEKSNDLSWNTKLLTDWILFCGYLPKNYKMWRINTRCNHWKEAFNLIHGETFIKQSFALKLQKTILVSNFIDEELCCDVLWGPECTRNCGVLGSSTKECFLLIAIKSELRNCSWQINKHLLPLKIINPSKTCTKPR